MTRTLLEPAVHALLRRVPACALGDAALIRMSDQAGIASANFQEGTCHIYLSPKCLTNRQKCYKKYSTDFETIGEFYQLILAPPLIRASINVLRENTLKAPSSGANYLYIAKMFTFKGRRGSIALVIALVVVIILVVAGGVWYYEVNSKQANQSASLPIGQTSPQVQSSTASGSKTIGWVDPQNTVYGFHFDVPDSWIEQPYGSERSIEVDSCSDTTAGCDANSMVSLHIDVNPPKSGDTLVIPDYTKQGETILSSSTLTVGGVPAQEIAGAYQNPDGVGKAPSSSVVVFILFQKSGVQYLASASGNQALENQTKPILAGILSSFAFDAPQTQQPPAEYQALQNLAGWTLTYQDKSINSLVCSDGSTGTMPQGYVFAMSASPYDESVDALYTNVVTTLQNSGWTQCNSNSSVPQDLLTVFSKSNRLIGIVRHYSMGTGNSLGVQIQY